MIKADFHVHTIHSKHHILWKLGLIDGLNTPREIVRYGKKIGLGAICITDHNRLLEKRKAKNLEKRYNIMVIPGAEMYSKGVGGEYIILGCENLIMGSSIQEIAKKVHEENGILIAPHPKDQLGRGLSNLNHVDAIECINGFGSIYKERKLNKAYVTGSDAHTLSMLGYSYTLVDASNHEEFFEEIRKRRTIPKGKPFPKSLLLEYYFNKYKIWLLR